MSEPGVWRRLYPLSPIVRGGRGTIGIVILLLPALLRGGISAGDLVPLGVIALITILGFVSWFVTRWTIDGDDLRIETGVLRRRSLRFPLSQVQAIDILRPGLGRLLGAAELRLRMGGSSGGAARLSYVAAGEVEQLRDQLLALAHGASPDQATTAAVAADEHVLTTVPTARLVASILISDVGFYAEAVLAALVVTALLPCGRLGRDQRRRPGLAAGRHHSHLAAVQPGIPADRRRCARRAAAERRSWSRSRPRRSGPAVCRPCGWWSRCCGASSAGAGSRSTWPADVSRRTATAPRSGASSASCFRLAAGRWSSRCSTGIVPDRPQRQSPPPRRVRFKSSLRYRMLAWGGTDTCVVTTSGACGAPTCWVPLEKVQSLRRVQGPVQRRLNLATVHVDTAGRAVRAALRDRDAAKADQALTRYAELARAARRTRA